MAGRSGASPRPPRHRRDEDHVPAAIGPADAERAAKRYAASAYASQAQKITEIRHCEDDVVDPIPGKIRYTAGKPLHVNYGPDKPRQVPDRHPRLTKTSPMRGIPAQITPDTLCLARTPWADGMTRARRFSGLSRLALFPLREER